jgi:hypothetical protein
VAGLGTCITSVLCIPICRNVRGKEKTSKSITLPFVTHPFHVDLVCNFVKAGRPHLAKILVD